MPSLFLTAESLALRANSASYSSKTEEPDCEMMANLIARSLSLRVDKDAKDFLRDTTNAMLRSTVVGATQACWFLLGLKFVRKSKAVITVNVLPVDQMTTRLRSVPEMEAAVEAEGDEATAVDSSPGSNLGRRHVYSAFLKQFDENGIKPNITYSAFLSRYRLTRHPLPKPTDDNAMCDDEPQNDSPINDPAVIFEAHEQDGEEEPGHCFQKEPQAENNASDAPVKKLARKSTKIEWQVLSEQDMATFQYSDSETGQIIDGPRYFLLPAASGGHIRCSWIGQPVVINASPNIPWSLQCERSCFATLLMHRVWPNGTEEDILDESSSATTTLDRLRKEVDGPDGLAGYAKILINETQKMEEAKSTQGKPGPLFPDADDDSGREEEDDDDSDVDTDAEILNDADPNSAPSLVPIDFSKSQLLPAAEYAQVGGHVAQILKETTAKHSSRFMRKTGQEPEPSKKIVPFEDDKLLEIETQLEENVVSFPFAENKGDPAQQGDIYDYADKRMNDESGKPLMMVVSGAAGTGKTRLIQALVNRGHQQWGKTHSQYGSVLVVAPTGCAAYNAGGFTWQSALSKGIDSEKKVTKRLTQALVNKIQKKLDGVKMLIFDEFSMLSCKDLVDVDRRLRAAQTDPELQKLPFGGIHVLFFGDFYQLPPVGGDSLYSTDLKYAASKVGRQLWEQFDVFGELLVNRRFKDPDGTLAKLAAKARVGDVCSHRDKELLDEVNKRVALSEDEAEILAHNDALWIAPKNEDCEKINQRKTQKLKQQGRQTCRIWARHVGSNETNEIHLRSRQDWIWNRLMKIAPKPQDKYHGRGIGLNKLDFCVGSQVRCTRNLKAMAGSYQGNKFIRAQEKTTKKKN